MTLLPHPWLAPRDIEDAPGIRLFCLPHAGSGAAVYSRWRRLLPLEIRICPLLLPGREVRLAEASLTSASRLATEMFDALRPLLAQPYAIFGHSMGSLIAYELARTIESCGLPPPKALFCSGRVAPNQPAAHHNWHKLPDQEFIQALRQTYGGLPEEFLEEPELRDIFLPILRADIKLVERYHPLSHPILQAPIWASAGTEDHTVSDAGLAAWAGLTTGAFTSARFPGRHFYHLAEGQTPILDWITKALAAN